MPSPGIDEKGNLDEGTLRRFVFQTYGQARRTQDSPIMPDTVWLRYIRIAEKIAHSHIRPGLTRPTDVVDLLLTLWSGDRPGRIVKKLQDQLGPIAKGTPDRDDDGVQRSPARVALSDTRIAICANFIRLCRATWCRCPVGGRSTSRTIREFEESLRQDHRRAPRGRGARHGRTESLDVALVGFVDCLDARPLGGDDRAAWRARLPTWAAKSRRRRRHERRARCGPRARSDAARDLRARPDPAVACHRGTAG